MKKIFILMACALLLVLGFQKSKKQTHLLKNQIEEIISDKKATVGVSIVGSNLQDTVFINGERRFPMQSVFKVYIALAVLSQIDDGILSLDQKIKITPNDLITNTWSPLRDENPNGGVISIAKIIEYTVSFSDNNGSDILLKLIGGPKVVEDYMKKNNIEDISIKYNEEEQHQHSNLQYQNWITPKASAEALVKFYLNNPQILSKKSYDFLWQLMKNTETGKNRLKGMLPQGTVVAHKTGTSMRNKDGVTVATNDVGVVFLPNGEYFFISVFVTDSKEDNTVNEKIIADIAKAVYDFYVI